MALRNSTGNARGVRRRVGRPPPDGSGARGVPAATSLRRHAPHATPGHTRPAAVKFPPFEKNRSGHHPPALALRPALSFGHKETGSRRTPAKRAQTPAPRHSRSGKPRESTASNNRERQGIRRGGERGGGDGRNDARPGAHSRGTCRYLASCRAGCPARGNPRPSTRIRSGPYPQRREAAERGGNAVAFGTPAVTVRVPHRRTSGVSPGPMDRGGRAGASHDGVSQCFPGKARPLGSALGGIRSPNSPRTTAGILRGAAPGTAPMAARNAPAHPRVEASHPCPRGAAGTALYGRPASRALGPPRACRAGAPAGTFRRKSAPAQRSCCR